MIQNISPNPVSDSIRDEISQRESEWTIPWIDSRTGSGLGTC